MGRGALPLKVGWGAVPTCAQARKNRCCGVKPLIRFCRLVPGANVSSPSLLARARKASLRPPRSAMFSPQVSLPLRGLPWTKKEDDWETWKGRGKGMGGW